MAEPVISVKGVSKKYRIGLADKKSDTMLTTILNGIKNPLANLNRIRNLSKLNDDDSSIFWALRDISFDVQEGEVLGIIGHNGAGKSTLLKILSQITEPSIGEVKIHGRVAALLEVGTGFHPELTGRENIYMNGTILGMTKKEINLKLDEIVDFSGVEKYLDTPVKFYSSGMRVRLGFAVAAHLEPEILIIDEVLSVGDAEFQKKCLGKMEDVAHAGRTVLFVSHNMNAVQTLCAKSILLYNGRNILYDDTDKVINTYLSKIGSRYTWQSKTLDMSSDKLRKLFVKEVKCSQHSIISIGDNFHIDVIVEALVPQDELVSINLFFKAHGETAFVACSKQTQLMNGSYIFKFLFPDNLFNNLNYQVDLMVVQMSTSIVFLKEVLLLDFIDDLELGWKGSFPGYIRPNVETIIEKV